MHSPRRKIAAWGNRVAISAAALILLFSPGAADAADTSDLVSETRLRVCADPANMPFSNSEGEGFENAIAELLADKMGRKVQYTWFPQATGFVRQTLSTGRCDVIMGYAQGDDFVLNTNHYYTSAYSILVPADGDLAGIDRLTDPRLVGATIGVTAGSPPATHLARLGLIEHVRTYSMMVDRRHEDPAAQMIADLKAGEIDAAILWGPIGGYHHKQAEGALELAPLLHEEGAPRLFYRITMGIRQGELRWKRELNSILRRNKEEIDGILENYGVPLVDDYGKVRVTSQ